MYSPRSRCDCTTRKKHAGCANDHKNTRVADCATLVSRCKARAVVSKVLRFMTGYNTPSRMGCRKLPISTNWGGCCLQLLAGYHLHPSTYPSRSGVRGSRLSKKSRGTHMCKRYRPAAFSKGACGGRRQFSSDWSY